MTEPANATTSTEPKKTAEQKQRSAWDRAKQRVKVAFTSKKQREAMKSNAEALAAQEGVIAGYTAALHSNGRAELILLKGTSAFQALALHGMATMRLFESIKAQDAEHAMAAHAADLAGKPCCDLMTVHAKAPNVVDCPTHGRRERNPPAPPAGSDAETGAPEPVEAVEQQAENVVPLAKPASA